MRVRRKNNILNFSPAKYSICSNATMLKTGRKSMAEANAIDTRRPNRRPEVLRKAKEGKELGGGTNENT